MEYTTVRALVYVRPDIKKLPKDHVNQLFKNSNGVYTFLSDIDDIIKGNGYFGAEPQVIYFAVTESVKTGDLAISKPSGNVYRVGNHSYTNQDGDQKIIAATSLFTQRESNPYAPLSLPYTSKLLPRVSEKFVKEFVNSGGSIAGVDILYKGSSPAVDKDGYVVMGGW